MGGLKRHISSKVISENGSVNIKTAFIEKLALIHRMLHPLVRISRELDIEINAWVVLSMVRSKKMAQDTTNDQN
jgi:hypothetical protein